MARQVIIQALLGLWLAVAAGLPGLQVGMAWAASGGHRCACPLDSEGDCACPTCARLGVHGEEHADSPAFARAVVSDCGGSEGKLASPPALDPAALPPALVPPSPAVRRLPAPAGRSLAPPQPDSSVPDRPS